MSNEDLPGVLSFLERFPDEHNRWQHLRKARWPHGFTCPMCSEDEDWIFLDNRNAGTATRAGIKPASPAKSSSRTRTSTCKPDSWPPTSSSPRRRASPATSWLATSRSTKETAWDLHQRLALIAGPYARRLFGIVEVDESYIGGNRDAETKGRSTAKAPVFGAVEAKDDAAGELVLEHVDNAQAETIDPHVEENVDQQARVRTDGLTTYRHLGKRTDREHELVRVAQQEEAHEIFPWIHTVWGNLKRVLSGVHTKASRAQWQDYLDLFSYRFNHRADLAEGLRKALGGLVQAGRVMREQLKGGAEAELY
jgi:transposase-like protein